MKKIFSILILFLLLSIKTNAYDYPPPQWNGFCPNQYANAEYIDYKQLKPSQKTGYLFYKFFIPGIDYVKLNNYWVERRNDFETEINYCNEIPETTERVGCYTQVAKVQRDANKTFYELQELKNELRYEQSRESHYINPDNYSRK